MFGNFGSDFVESMTGVENVVDQQHIAIFDVQHHFRVDGQLTTFSSLVTACLQHADSKWHSKLANQIGAQNDAPGKDADDGEWLVAVVFVDALSELFNAVVELFFVEKCFHGSFALWTGKPIL